VKVRLTQLDGSLPNLALAKLAAWHKEQGHEVVAARTVEPDLFDHPGMYDRVYGSAIFQFSAPRVERFRRAWPDAIIGGTGSDNTGTVEDLIGDGFGERYDFTAWPEFRASIGFTQRGCRLRCGFCVVPTKEGANRSVATIAEIWRGDGHPKQIHLLDNDFFGQPRDQWQARLAEIRDGGYKVCLNQGINVRLLNDEAAAALATIEYRDDDFQRRRLYTAWDNIGDEGIFFKGVDRLEEAGIPPKHLMAYMLIGYDPAETWDRIWYRFGRMVERGILPYPMNFDKAGRPDLRAFARWVITSLYRGVPWDQYEDRNKSPESVEAWHRHKSLVAVTV
jgi:hypothetical protein